MIISDHLTNGMKVSIIVSFTALFFVAWSCGTDSPVDNIFWSETNIGLSTVTNVAAKNLNTSVLHTFGLTRGGIDRFWDGDFRIGFNINRMFGLGR